MKAKTETRTMQERPPIIVVMGHIDHGKSSLLDYIRKSSIVEGEAGGITQHVAAYEVEHEIAGEKKRVTFIDTPGHAAFTSIRARGVTVADIAILVVSAEEGVKEQTLEALESIKESGIPYVVAITKIDKPAANVDKIKTDLLENGIYVEGYGGSVPFAAVSSKTGEGMNDLLDTLLLVAQMEELTGDTSLDAEGFVLEAHRDPRRGIAASLIVTNGSMKSGMAVAAKGAIAPLRIMEDGTGKEVRKAAFSTPVLVVGFDEMPPVGSPFKAYKNRRAAEKARGGNTKQPKAEYAKGDEEVFVLPIVIKADATGSLEAIRSQLEQMGNEHARVRVIHGDIGPISEGDVKTALASGTQAGVVGFNEEADPAALELARQNEMPITSFSIIYELTEYVGNLLTQFSPKRHVEEIVGRARVMKNFSRQKKSQVIGGKVEEGVLEKGIKIRILRRGTKVGEAKISNLQTNRQNVNKVDEGSEFGGQFESESEIAAGDILESVIVREV